MTNECIKTTTGQKADIGKSAVTVGNNMKVDSGNGSCSV